MTFDGRSLTKNGAVLVVPVDGVLGLVFNVGTPAIRLKEGALIWCHRNSFDRPSKVSSIICKAKNEVNFEQVQVEGDGESANQYSQFLQKRT